LGVLGPQSFQLRFHLRFVHRFLSRIWFFSA
jgi:hypothetical protein